jgi:Ca-activated chloride channel homolog
MSKLNGQPHKEDASRKETEAANVTAYALGQMSGEERAQFETKLSPEQLVSAKKEAQTIQSLAATVRTARTRDQVSPSANLRALVEQRLNKRQAHVVETRKAQLPKRKKRRWQLHLAEFVVLGGICCLLVSLFMPAVQPVREASRRTQANNRLRKLGLSLRNYHDSFSVMPGETSSVHTDELRMMVTPRIVVQEDEVASLGFELPDSGQSLGVPTRVWRELRDREGIGTENYAPINENAFLSPRQHPLSTFSIDVDTASYSNVRRFLTNGQLPPADAVRIEELVNYFRYEYPPPKAGEPFSVSMEVAECPWREGHRLLRVGLKGREVPRTQRPASNLVFLLDVSGSMADENKLPLLKTAMKMLVGELGEDDRVSIVTYAGEAGLKLSPTRGHQQAQITRVIDSLHAGGSTNGSAGIELAYEQATSSFIAGGTNRVILCTDGDLNVGVTSDEALTKLIKQKAKSDVFLSVLGFGTGNLKDGKLERLADNGNGLYAYIDSVREARKVLVEQLTGSTITIAKDVKIQIEFNPAQVAAYRLLGYENRVLAAQDFNNDKKDAGEIGAGHTVTALYELVPVSDASQKRAVVEPLKYQESGIRSQESVASGRREPPDNVARELLTLKLRYKQPDGDTSKLLEYPLSDRGGSFGSASTDFQFAAGVASFGMILRGSEHRGTSNLAAVAEIASSALGTDPGGYRAEFVDLVRKAQTLEAR